jgi:hypothetical protein
VRFVVTGFVGAGAVATLLLSYIFPLPRVIVSGVNTGRSGMNAIYLYINAALYLTFAIWMTLSPWKTAAAVGYQTLAPNGRSEFLVIYGGLQLGLAIFFAIVGATPNYHRLGILFALCLYAPIVIYRVVTVLKFEVNAGNTIAIGGLEVALLIGAIVLYLKSSPNLPTV